VLAPPGMKPDGSGGFKVAGAHPETFLLENENGARAVIDTHTLSCTSWKTASGKELMKGKGSILQCFPDASTPIKGEFIPEERAKKLSFDRMIFKLEPTEETLKIWNHNFEYRVDITLRENSLEWDVIVINLDTQPWTCTLGLHNYFDVSSLANVVVSGAFSGADTVCKVTGATGKAASNDVKVTSAIDMLYKKVAGPVTITDTGKKTKLTLERKGYTDTCIWSPYGHESWNYDKFICVEPVQVDPVSIPPGKFKETKFYQKVTYEKL